MSNAVAEREEALALCNAENMKILMCGNDNVFRGMLLAMLSVTKHTSRGIDLYIGTMELTELDERYTPVTEEMCQVLESVLKAANPLSRVRLLRFDDSFRRELIDSKNLDVSYTPYTMVRLFADEIEEIGDKLLYLDTDVMARGDISELYETELGNAHMAGARDFFGKFFFSPSYLNAGVLLFNMRTMREDGIFLRCRRLCNDKKLFLLDQNALNRFAKRKVILNRRFNEQHKTKKDTLIRHYAMTIKWFPYFHTETVKPWQPELIRDKLGDVGYEDIYAEYERIKAASPKEFKL